MRQEVESFCVSVSDMKVVFVDSSTEGMECGATWMDETVCTWAPGTDGARHVIAPWTAFRNVAEHPRRECRRSAQRVAGALFVSNTKGRVSLDTCPFERTPLIAMAREKALPQ